MREPLWLRRTLSTKSWELHSAAFGATFAAVFLLVPGVLGYELHKSNWSFMRVTVSDGPVWWQIYVGLVFVLLPAMYFWRKALRALP
jgi:hypothetical protein